MENKSYTKLKDLVGSTFEVEQVYGYKWKKWDEVERKMLVSDIYQEGYRKLYQVDTNKGQLDLGTGQLGSLLEAVFEGGKADLINKTFEVKSNGKEGMDIRYFFNLLRSTPKPVDTILPPETDLSSDDSVDLNSIPF